MSANIPIIAIHRFIFMALLIDSNEESIEPFKFSISSFIALESSFVSAMTEI